MADEKEKLRSDVAGSAGVAEGTVEWKLIPQQRSSSEKMPTSRSSPLHNPIKTGALEHTHRPVLQSTTTDNSLQSTPFAQSQSVVQYDIGRPIHPSKSHMKNINIDVGSRFQPTFIGEASDAKGSLRAPNQWPEMRAPGSGSKSIGSKSTGSSSIVRSARIDGMGRRRKLRLGCV